MAVTAVGLLYADAASALVLDELKSVSRFSEPYQGYVPVKLEMFDFPRDLKIQILPLTSDAADAGYISDLKAEYSEKPSPRIVIRSTQPMTVPQLAFKLSVASEARQTSRDMLIALEAVPGTVARVSVPAEPATAAVVQAPPQAQPQTALPSLAPPAVPAAAPPAVAAVVPSRQIVQTAPVEPSAPVAPATPVPQARMEAPLAAIVVAAPTQPAPEQKQAVAEPVTAVVVPEAVPVKPVATATAEVVKPLPEAIALKAPEIPAVAASPAPVAPIKEAIEVVEPVKKSLPEQDRGPVAPVESVAVAPVAAVAAITPVIAAKPGELPLSNSFFVDVAPQQAMGTSAQKARKAEESLRLKPSKDGRYPAVAFVSGGTLDHLRAAEDWRASGALRRSIEHYDAAESALKAVETKSMAESGGRMLASLVINDNAMSYMPSPSEAVLMNFEKAVSFWALGEDANARIEFNRLEDRTRRAVERYSSEIDKAEAADAKNAGTYKAAGSSDVLNGVNAKIPEFSQWRTYSEFVNPAATYLHALFLARKGDPGDVSSAQNFMQRVVGIIGGNEYVEKDLADLKAKGAVCPADNCSWIMVEAGKGPLLEERRISTLFPSPSGNVYSVTVALPVLTSRGESGGLRIDAPGGALNAPVLGDMDIVVQTEFKKRWPGVVSRAIGGAAVKAVAQKEIAARAGLFGSLVGAVGSVLVTRADTRIWDEMPGRWYLVRIDGAQGSDISLTGSGLSMPVHLPKEPALIYVKAPDDAGSSPLVHTLNLSRFGKVNEASIQ